MPRDSPSRDSPSPKSPSRDSLSRPLPAQLRVASVLIGLEALALCGLALGLAVKALSGHPHSLAGALLGALLALVGAVVLGLCDRGLLARRPAARTPVVVLQILAVPVSYSLGFQAGRIAYGAPILISALVVLYLLFTPAVRQLLDR